MKRRIVVLGAAVLAAAAAAVWWSRPGGPPEPVYRGKTLGAWLDERRKAPMGPVVLTDEAEAAVRAIGPKAVPTLLAWLRSSEPTVARQAKILLEWRLKLPVRVPTNMERRERAMYGFRALGPAAAPAFPVLVSLVLNSPDSWIRRDAINALCSADADAMRRLADGLKSPDREVRLRAVDALVALRIAPDAVCLPALERAANDPDPQVRAEAVIGINFIKQQLGAVAAALTNPKAGPDVRAVAARTVGGYGPRARDHLPVLEAAARDDDPDVRDAAAEAVRRVRGPEPAPAQ